MNLARLPLPALLAQWARIVDYVEREAPPAAEFLADVDVRHEIATRVRGNPVPRETREMLAELDEAFRQVTREREVCLHAVAHAESQGWTPAREWYYWREPFSTT